VSGLNPSVRTRPTGTAGEIIIEADNEIVAEIAYSYARKEK
jgi:hypothetical protein